MPSLVRLSAHAVAGFAIAIAPLFAHRADAQLPIPSLGIAGGITHFDPKGSDAVTTPFGAVRLDIPLIALIAEGSLGAFRPTESGGTRTYIVPEAQLQFPIFPFIVRPYVGVGAGWVQAITGPDPHPNNGTISASAGVRAGLPLVGFGLRAEVRVRTIGSGFSSRAAEWTLGVSR
jgi:hypothetical protein